MTRVVAVGLLAGSLTGALALRPTSHAAPALASTQPALQASVVLGVQVEQASAARAEADRVAALRASRAIALSRHRAYLGAKAAQVAAREAARQAAREAAQQAARRAATTRPAAAKVVVPVENPVARGQRIYASLHYDVRALGYRMVIKPGARGLLGLTDAGTRTITVYVRTTESDLVVAHSIAHEIGHAVDFTRGSSTRRALYLSIRHLGSQAWFGCNDCTDYSTPAGDWAEVFAQWLAGPGDFRSRMAGPPSATQLTLLTPLFAL